jgi:hypothetical protein
MVILVMDRINGVIKHHAKYMVLTSLLYLSHRLGRSVTEIRLALKTKLQLICTYRGGLSDV